HPCDGDDPRSVIRIGHPCNAILGQHVVWRQETVGTGLCSLTRRGIVEIEDGGLLRDKKTPATRRWLPLLADLSDRRMFDTGAYPHLSKSLEMPERNSNLTSCLLSMRLGRPAWTFRCSALRRDRRCWRRQLRPPSHHPDLEWHWRCCLQAGRQRNP